MERAPDPQSEIATKLPLGNKKPFLLRRFLIDLILTIVTQKGYFPAMDEPIL